MPTCVACYVAMISTLLSVWLRPAVLGGFGGMSDRSRIFCFFHLFVSSWRRDVGRRFAQGAFSYHLGHDFVTMTTCTCIDHHGGVLSYARRA